MHIRLRLLTKEDKRKKNCVYYAFALCSFRSMCGNAADASIWTKDSNGCNVILQMKVQRIIDNVKTSIFRSEFKQRHLHAGQWSNEIIAESLCITKNSYSFHKFDIEWYYMYIFYAHIKNQFNRTPKFKCFIQFFPNFLSIRKVGSLNFEIVCSFDKSILWRVVELHQNVEIKMYQAKHCLGCFFFTKVHRNVWYIVIDFFG